MSIAAHEVVLSRICWHQAMVQPRFLLFCTTKLTEQLSAILTELIEKRYDTFSISLGHHSRYMHRPPEIQQELYKAMPVTEQGLRSFESLVISLRSSLSVSRVSSTCTRRSL